MFAIRHFSLTVCTVRSTTQCAVTTNIHALSLNTPSNPVWHIFKFLKSCRQPQSPIQRHCWSLELWVQSFSIRWALVIHHIYCHRVCYIIYSSFPHVIPNLYDFLSSMELRRRHFAECWCCFCSYNENKWWPGVVELHKCQKSTIKAP